MGRKRSVGRRKIRETAFDFAEIRAPVSIADNTETLHLNVGNMEREIDRQVSASESQRSMQMNAAEGEAGSRRPRSRKGRR